MKVSAYGDITISIVNEPFSVHLSNEAQQFPTDENRKVANSLSYYTDVNVIKGEVSNPNFTIGEIHSANGITVSKNANRITFSVKAGTILPSDSGSFDIPVTLNDETLVKTFSWSCQKDGTKAKSVKITADSTVFKSSDGETYSPDTILLTPILQGNISFSKWQYGAGSKWTDIKTGTHGFTLSSTSLILSKTSDLFTVETTSINIRCLSSDEKYYDVITIQKTRDGKDADTIGLDGRNRISFSSGEYQKGFFKNFNKVDKGYGEHTLTSKKQYSSLNLNDGFLLGCRDYKTGKKVTFSYDIMYTEWNFPTGTDRREFWIGQRYTNSTDSSAVGAWRGVTMHNLPVVGENGCKLGAWYHVSKTMLIPEQADESIGTASSIQFYNSNSEKEAKVTFRMKNVKLEYGEKETDWSPAPEDNISSIKILENIASKNTLDITTKVGKVDTFLVTNPDTGKEEQKTISEFMSSSTQNMYGFKREVKQQYNDLELGGVNLFVQNTAIEGKYLSSENVEINDVAWGYSDYINVSDMDYYIASGFTNLGNAPATCFYSADKVFLSGVKSELANSKESKRKMLQIPDGAVYMRFSFLLADAKTLKIEKGTKSTSYSPSPDDVAHNIKTVEEQTKDMFSWLVESGSSETSLKITNGLIEAITGKFVVKSPNGKSVVIENGAINAESITTDMLSANSITAEKIMADALKSKNYVTGKSGSFLNLADGSFDSKYLKWDNAGKVIANDITVVGGSINVNDKFIVNNDGIATLQGATVVGNITAESGKIGKFDLDNLALVTGDTDVTCAGLGGSSQAFWAGSLTMDNAPFRVGYDGSLYASKANIAGEITATSGKIGKYRIDDYLITGSGSTCTGMGGDQAFWAGSDDSSKAPFHVSYDGSLYASKANISGIINSTDGSIGGWKISSNKLSAFTKIKVSNTDDASEGERDVEYSISLLSSDNNMPKMILDKKQTAENYDIFSDTLTTKTEISDDSIKLSSTAEIASVSETDIDEIIINPRHGIEMKQSFSVPDSPSESCSITYGIDGITCNGSAMKLLWDGANYMNGAQTITFYNEETVLKQFSGIVLVWSRYNTNTNQASNSDVHTQFISKWCVKEMNGAGHTFVDPYRHFDKYFYVYNDKIVGNDVNGHPGTEGGLSYDNRNCVLRAVIGV